MTTQGPPMFLLTTVSVSWSQNTSHMDDSSDSYNNFGSCFGIRTLTGGDDDVVGNELWFH